MNWRDYIVSDPQILVGKPTIKGTRISVQLILELFAGGWTLDEVRESYPHLTPTMIQAAFMYAAEVVDQEAVKPQAA